MTEKKDINVQLIRNEEEPVPFIEVGYVDKEAHEHTGLAIEVHE